MSSVFFFIFGYSLSTPLYDFCFSFSKNVFVAKSTEPSQRLYVFYGWANNIRNHAFWKAKMNAIVMSSFKLDYIEWKYNLLHRCYFNCQLSQYTDRLSVCLIFISQTLESEPKAIWPTSNEHIDTIQWRFPTFRFQPLDSCFHAENSRHTRNKEITFLLQWCI